VESRAASAAGFDGFIYQREVQGISREHKID
jgi:hypothetical protein